jgi:hypothetical protein
MKAFDKIEKKFLHVFGQRGDSMSIINRLQMSLYNLSTAFPQKFGKISKAPVFQGPASYFCLFCSLSCSYVKKVTGKPQPLMENSSSQ